MSDKDSAGDMDQGMNDLEGKVTELENQVIDLEAEKELLKQERNSLDQANKVACFLSLFRILLTDRSNVQIL